MTKELFTWPLRIGMACLLDKVHHLFPSSPSNQSTRSSVSSLGGSSSWVLGPLVAKAGMQPRGETGLLSLRQLLSGRGGLKLCASSREGTYVEDSCNNSF